MQLSLRASRYTGETTLAYAQLSEKSRVKPVIDLTLGQPDLPPPSTLVELLTAEARTLGASRYAPPQGLQELREALAYHMRESYGVDATPQQIVVLAGAKPGIAAAIYALTDPDDYIVVLTPHFYAYVNAASMLSTRVVLVKLSWSSGLLRLDHEVFKAAVERYKPKLVIINTPHNPTGLLLAHDDVKLVIDLGLEKGYAILSDEVYAWLVYEGGYKPLVSIEPSIVIHLESFSKTLAVPGWRIGFIYAPPEVVKAVTLFNSNVYTCIPRFVQTAIAKYITSYRDDMEAHVEAMRSTYKRRAEVFISHASRIAGLLDAYKPQAGFFLFPRARGLIEKMGVRDARELAVKLAVDAGVLVVPGTVFGDWSEYVRISLTAPESKLKEAIDRVARLAEEGRV